MFNSHVVRSSRRAIFIKYVLFFVIYFYNALIFFTAAGDFFLFFFRIFQENQNVCRTRNFSRRKNNISKICLVGYSRLVMFCCVTWQKKWNRLFYGTFCKFCKKDFDKMTSLFLMTSGFFIVCNTLFTHNL